VCRHRAYAFVVTAQALGIPARFLQNEAHSWVEVKLPSAGFLRIDLGGAAHGLTTHGASDRPVYTPVQPDTLPRPEAYRQSYSTLQQGVTGLRPKPEDVMGRWVSPSQASSTQTSSVFMAGPQAGGLADTTGRKPLTITLENRQVSVLRGGKLSLTGRLTDQQGRGVRDLRIEISIAATQREDRMLLGVTVTDERGHFHAALGVPPDLSVGDYKLVVLTPGDARYLPVVAQ
jgi:hypothetical protein